MLNQLNFWVTWSTGYKRIFFTITFLAVTSLALLWISYYQTPGPAIPTEQYQQLETQEIAVHSFSFAGITLTTTGDNYLLFEYLKGGAFTVNRVTSYLFLGLLTTAMVMLLSVVTTLGRFWYFVGMGLFILFIVGFRLETTFLFNLSNKVPTIAVLALFGGVSYYFHFFNRNVSFQARLACFSLLTFAFLIAFLFFSKTKDPFLHLASNGIIAGTILSIVFILTVAHEILAFFVNIISHGVKQTKSLRHFVIISTIYMLNLSLTYATRKGFIKWDFLSINMFLLLTISAVLGLWGFRQREKLYSNILPANPFGSYLFLSLALICFATIAFFLGTTNDPPLQLIQDTIMYSHLGYGIIFFCYILANFTSMLANNQQVFKILYNPKAMPYFTFRFGGLIATFTFFAYSTYSISVHQFFAGYYNAIGDVYLYTGETAFSESYYDQSLLYSNRNHHAHYALASLSAQRLELKNEKKHYEKAADTRPTELSYLNLGLSYQRDQENLLANNILIQAMNDFPSSGKVKNALGLSYATLNLRDSALIMLEKAKDNYSSKSVAETNLVGVMAKFKFPYPVDSIAKLIGEAEKGAKTNALALANQQKVQLNMELPAAKDTVLTVYEATLLNNYILNRFDKIDTTLLTSLIYLARRPANKYYKAALLDAIAQSYYANGEINKAFNFLSENAFLDRSGKMYNTLGLWALEQGNAEVALAEFNFAIDQQFEGAELGKALALSELGNEKEAIATWTELTLGKDTTFQTIATSFLKVYSANKETISALNDLQRYQFVRFRVSLQDQVLFNSILSSIANSDFRAMAILDRSKKLFELDEAQSAADLISTLQGVSLKNQALYGEIQEFNLQLLASARDFKTLGEQLTELPDGTISKSDKIYFEALVSKKSNDNSKSTFEWLSRSNPFNEEATIDGISFMKKASSDKLKAFNLLVGAVSTNPGSIKLMKAYIIEAANLGFDDYAQESLDKLKLKISPANFNKFVKANPTVFQIIPN